MISQSLQEPYLMNGNTITSGLSRLCSGELETFLRDYYAGKIKIEHGEDCEDDCKIDHGYYNIGREYSPIFEEPK